MENDRSTPIFLAQTAIAILERDFQGKLKRVIGEHNWIMLLSKARISETAWNGIISEAEKVKIKLKLYDLAEEDPYSGKTYEGQDLREKGRGKTRYLMSKAEFAIVDEFRKNSRHIG